MRGLDDLWPYNYKFGFLPPKRTLSMPAHCYHALRALCSAYTPYIISTAVERWKQQLLLPRIALQTMRRPKWRVVTFQLQTSRVSWRLQSKWRWCGQAVSSIKRVWRGVQSQPYISCASFLILTASLRTL